MELDSEPNPIFEDALAEIRSILGSSLEEITLERVVLGLFFTGVKLSNGVGGLSATPIKLIPEAVCCPSSAKAMPDSGRLRGKKVSEIVAGLFTQNPLKKAVAIAVLNALSETCRTMGAFNDYEYIKDADPIDFMQITKESFTVVIGALLPYLRTLRKGNYPYAILELDPRTLKPEEMPYYVPPQKASAVIADADYLLITGTTLINDTLDTILQNRKKSSTVAVLGPTASLVPGALMPRGVDYLGGIVVTHPDSLLDVISEAGSGYHFYGKSADKVVVRKKIPAPILQPVPGR